MPKNNKKDLAVSEKSITFAADISKHSTMDTMTIAFEDRNMISVIKNLINAMKGVSIIAHSDVDTTRQHPVAKTDRYRISPKIKAMESGYSLPDDISDNYKKEISEFKAKSAL